MTLSPAPPHVNVHFGQPGMIRGVMVTWVQGSEGDLTNCAGQMND